MSCFFCLLFPFLFLSVVFFFFFPSQPLPLARIKQSKSTVTCKQCVSRPRSPSHQCQLSCLLAPRIHRTAGMMPARSAVWVVHVEGNDGCECERGSLRVRAEVMGDGRRVRACVGCWWLLWLSPCLVADERKGRGRGDGDDEDMDQAVFTIRLGPCRPMSAGADPPGGGSEVICRGYYQRLKSLVSQDTNRSPEGC